MKQIETVSSNKTILTNTSSKNNKKKWAAFLPYILISPIVLWIVVTIFLPLTNVIKESFFNTGFVGTEGSFVGLTNYVEVLASSDYWTAWGKSLIWVIGNGFCQTLLAFAIALYLNRQGKIAQWARTWMIIPWVIPTIVVAIFWQWIFNGSYGILNQVLLSIGLIDKPINLLGDPLLSLPIIIFINAWHWFPFMAVIILAGLSIIPDDLYEASGVDGANKWQQFWSITFPSLGPIMFALGLVGTLWTFNIFDIIYILTEGGPAGVTTTVPVYIYQQAFDSYQLGKASAISVITAIFLLIFVSLFIKFAAPKED
jgi:multiple sugar transport system permease protein